MPSMFGGLPEPLEASRTLGEVSFAKRVNQHNWTGFKRLWGHPRWFSTESYSSGLCFCRLDSVLFEITLYMPFLPNCLRYFTAGSVVSLPPKAWLLFTFCRVHFAPNTALTALIFSEKKRDSQAKYLSTSNITCTLLSLFVRMGAEFKRYTTWLTVTSKCHSFMSLTKSSK